jgi:hypothetical protein
MQAEFREAFEQMNKEQGRGFGISNKECRISKVFEQMNKEQGTRKGLAHDKQRTGEERSDECSSVPCSLLICSRLSGHKTKKPLSFLKGFFNKYGSYLLSQRNASTIGHGGLNFSVRNGKR